MDVCLRSFGFRPWAEGPLGLRCGDVTIFGFGLALQGFKVKVEKWRVQGFGCKFFMFGLGEGYFEFRV